MKLIPYVAPVPLSDTRRRPYMAVAKNADGSDQKDEKGAPVLVRQTMTQRELFLARLEDQRLTAGKTPLVAAKFSNAVYDAIEGQSDEAVEARGGWKFEDDHADAICKVVRLGPAPSQGDPNGGYNPLILHCMAPLLDAVENAKPWKDPPVEPKQLNGAEKALPASSDAAQA